MKTWPLWVTPRRQELGGQISTVCFDCAKVRSKFLLADFYGRVLIPPTVVAHNRPARHLRAHH
jgi:hypothetical protein